MSHQVATHVELAFLDYHTMVVATWLDPLFILTQSWELNASDSLEMMLQIGHELEWPSLFNGLPLLLVLTEKVEELRPQLLPLLQGGRVEVAVEKPKYAV